MGFYKGQEIECISDDWDASPLYLGSIPIKGTIYHFACYHPIDPDYIMIQEFGFIYSCGTPAGFIARAFRPLVSTKTDISIFTAMLGPRQKETVDGR